MEKKGLDVIICSPFLKTENFQTNGVQIAGNMSLDDPVEKLSVFLGVPYFLG